MKRSLLPFALMILPLVILSLILTLLKAPVMAAVPARQESAAAKEVPVTYAAPYTFARAHQHLDWVDGQFEPNATVSITVSDATGQFKGAESGTADSSGWMNGAYAGADIVPGDKIDVVSSGGFSATLEMITITARVDLASDLVTGVMSGGVFPATGNVEAHRPMTGTGMPISITASGHFTGDFSGSFDIVEGDEVWVWYTDASGNEVGASAFYPFLRLSANYAHDWINGWTEPGTSVAISLTDNTATVKASTTVTADESGFFTTTCLDWSTAPACPDIMAGDSVAAAAAGLAESINPLGNIDGTLDDSANTVSGTLDAGWFAGSLEVRCEVWVEDGPAAISTTADADGGSFECDFDDVNWDLEPGQEVAIMYVEPDGDMVINVLGWPWMRVNYGQEWAGGDYEAGHTIWITVSDSADAVKATAIVTSAPGNGWNGAGFQTEPPHWAPGNPDIAPGDSVAFATDDGYHNLVDVGLINGVVDGEANSASGTISVPWFSEALLIECHPWGAWEEGIPANVMSSTAAPDGSSSFTCDWSGEWDIQPQQAIAVMYLEPDGDRVMDVFYADTSTSVYLPLLIKP